MGLDVGVIAAVQVRPHHRQRVGVSVGNLRRDQLAGQHRHVRQFSQARVTGRAQRRLFGPLGFWRQLGGELLAGDVGRALVKLAVPHEIAALGGRDVRHGHQLRLFHGRRVAHRGRLVDVLRQALDGARELFGDIRAVARDQRRLVRAVHAARALHAPQHHGRVVGEVAIDGNRLAAQRVWHFGQIHPSLGILLCRLRAPF